MRSDKLKAHIGACGKPRYPKENCPICQKLMIKWHMTRHMKQHDNHVLIDLKEDQVNYEKLVEMGKIIEEHVNREDIDPRSLRNEFVTALDVHHDAQTQEEIGSLNAWQKKLLGLMNPSERNILWVRGSKGNEGKSWFQNYLENYYGKRRVFRSTVIRRSESLLHALTKRNLSFLDIFIFNVPRSFDTEHVPYGFLEDIKDGKAISSKYNSKELKFVTPNIVIVFSNDAPYVDKLSADRWMRYDISNDRLNTRKFSKNKNKFDLNQTVVVDDDDDEEDYYKHKQQDTYKARSLPFSGIA